MSLSSLLLQFLTGLSSASSLFLVGAGLSLIFGVTRETSSGMKKAARPMAGPLCIGSLQGNTEEPALPGLRCCPR